VISVGESFYVAQFRECTPRAARNWR